MKARFKNKVLITVSLFFVLTSYSNLFSQDAPDLMKKIKKGLETAPRWLAYKAFIQGDTGICDSASGDTNSPQVCWSLLKSLVFVQSLANGNCNSLPPQYRDFGDLCYALSDTKCNNITGYKKTMCEALRSRNTNLMVAAMSDTQYPFYVKNKVDAAEFSMNLYYGFKNRSETSCNKFTSSNLLRMASCNMLFGNQSFEKRLDSLTQDIYYAIESKTSCNTDTCTKSCNSINNPLIKEACEDDSIKGLNGIIRKIWQ
jgi:hypothetical protein